jgi:hypothetical protein
MVIFTEFSTGEREIATAPIPGAPPISLLTDLAG